MRLSNAAGIFVCFSFLPANDKMLFLINSSMRVNELRMTLPGLGCSQWPTAHNDKRLQFPNSSRKAGYWSTGIQSFSKELSLKYLKNEQCSTKSLTTLDSA